MALVITIFLLLHLDASRGISGECSERKKHHCARTNALRNQDEIFSTPGYFCNLTEFDFVLLLREPGLDAFFGMLSQRMDAI